jgi:hypothetical protein
MTYFAKFRKKIEPAHTCRDPFAFLREFSALDDNGVDAPVYPIASSPVSECFITCFVVAKIAKQ